MAIDDPVEGQVEVHAAEVDLEIPMVEAEAYPTPIESDTVQDESVCVGVCICGHCHLDATTKNSEKGNADSLDMNQQILQPDDDGRRHYKSRHDWNEPIFHGAPTTKFEVFLSILHLAMRHGMSGPFIEDQLKFVNALIGTNVIPTSYYTFKQLFTPHSALQFHFYCPNCELYLGEVSSFRKDSKKLIICNVCETECNVHDLNGGNSFVTLSVRHQIENLLKRRDIQFVQRSNIVNDNISDVMDGQIYQDLCQEGCPLSEPNSLTLTFNTDGAKVFNSGKGSLWPIQFFVNEVVPEERLRVQNVMLAGLWFGKGSPNMSVFFAPFIKEMQDLAKNGVERRVAPNDAIVKCPVFAVMCSVDSVAKPKILSMKQFNGRFGCGLCYHPNTSVVIPGKNVKSRKYTASVQYPYRTHTEIVEDMYAAEILKREGLLSKSNIGKENEVWDDVNGVKGISPLIELPGFNFPFSCVIDYMHLIMNIVQRLYDLFFAPASKGNAYWLGDHEGIISLRLEKITPPQKMSRRPRSLKDFADWKATECRSFLLFYLLPCIEDVLPKKYLENVQDLVSGFQCLLQESISKEQLAQADAQLQSFVKTFNVLYGDSSMTYNIHMCTHLAHVVSMCGPLWAYSAFPFESGNGHLVKLVKGTTGVISQIGHKYATVQAVPQYTEGYNVSGRIMRFCNNICSYSLLHHTLCFENNVTALGQEIICRSSNDERQAMSEVVDMPVLDEFTYFNRVIRHKMVFYSGAYARPERFNDTCVAMKNGGYAVIHKMVRHPHFDALWAFVYPIRLCDSEYYLAPHIKTCAHHAFAPMCWVPMSDIIEKCCFVCVESRKFVCVVPNKYERD